MCGVPVPGTKEKTNKAFFFLYPAQVKFMSLCLIKFGIHQQ